MRRRRFGVAALVERFHRAGVNAPLTGIAESVEIYGFEHVRACVRRIQESRLLAAYADDITFAGYCRAVAQAERMRTA